MVILVRGRGCVRVIGVIQKGRCHIMAKVTAGKAVPNSKGTTKSKGKGLPNQGRKSTAGLKVLCRVVITPLGSRALGTAVTLYKGGTVGSYCVRINVKAGKFVTWQGYSNLPKAQKGFNGLVNALTKAAH